MTEEDLVKKETITLNKINIALVLTLLFSFFIRLYYYFMTRTQTVWWDEAAYLIKAKSLAFPYYLQHIPGIVGRAFNPARSPLYSLILAFFYKLGLTETFFRLPSVLLSVGTIFLVFLLGKELFDKKTGLLASIFASVMWVDFYVITRIFPDAMSLFFVTLATYLFVKGFVKKEHKYYGWFFFPVLIIAVMAREINILFLAIILIYWIIIEKKNFLKNKDVYYSILFGAITSIPYFIYNQLQYGNPLFQIISRYHSMTNVMFGQKPVILVDPLGTLVYWKLMPDYFVWPLMIVFLIGLVFLLDIFLGLGLIWKQENKYLNNKFFLFLYILVPLLFFGFIYTLYDPRYIMIIFPAAYIIAANGIIKLSEYIKKHTNKIIALIFIIFVVLSVGYVNLNKADNLVKTKLDSQWQIKEAGLWLKENTAEDDIIISQSHPQLVLYSERQIERIPLEETETEFENKIKDLHPKYMVLAAFEQHLPWMFEYPAKHNDTWTPVQAYASTKDGKGQLAVIIYKYNP